MESVLYVFRNISFHLLLVALILSSCGLELKSGEGKPPNHLKWDDLLKKHVNQESMVDYRGFKSDSIILNEYLKELYSSSPAEFWSEAEKKAYWINLYNAATIKLIIDDYPLESIKDLKSGIAIPFINSIWDKKFIPIAKTMLSLNDVEHNILRADFNDPRIHFAINCASISCPGLRNQAYFADSLNEQLEEQAIIFINDKSRNEITMKEIRISKIFLWFRFDFTDSRSLIEFLNMYSEVKISKDADIEYLEYNWKLNDSLRPIN